MVNMVNVYRTYKFPKFYVLIINLMQYLMTFKLLNGLDQTLKAEKEYPEKSS